MANDDVVTVSDVLGDGDKAHRLVRVGAWELTAWVGDGEREPRVRDLDLAARLGYERVTKIRDLIKGLVSAGKLKDIAVFPAAVQTSGGRPTREFWLTEAQALKVVAKSETAKADALLDEVIAVFILARKGLLPPPQTASLTPQQIAAIAAAAAVATVQQLLGDRELQMTGVAGRGPLPPGTYWH